MTVRLFSVYSPCYGQQGKVFLSNLSHRLPIPSATTPPLLLGGDWNCVVDSQLDSSNPLGSNTGGVELRNLLLTHSLSDSYRQINPRKRFFTNSGTTGTNRRLDYIFLCPQLKNLVQKVTSWDARGSTHVPIVTDLAVPGLTPKAPAVSSSVLTLSTEKECPSTSSTSPHAFTPKQRISTHKILLQLGLTPNLFSKFISEIFPEIWQRWRVR